MTKYSKIGESVSKTKQDSEFKKRMKNKNKYDFNDSFQPADESKKSNKIHASPPSNFRPSQNGGLERMDSNEMALPVKPMVDDAEQQL